MGGLASEETTDGWRNAFPLERLSVKLYDNFHDFMTGELTASIRETENGILRDSLFICSSLFHLQRKPNSIPVPQLPLDWSVTLERSKMFRN